MRRFLTGAVLAAAITLIAVGTARALINPKFTPIHLVEQSDLILVLKLGAPDAKQQVAVEVRKCLKGKAPAGKMTIDLSKSAQKDRAKAIGEAIARLGDEPAMLFVGKDEEKEDAAFLHLAGQWVRLAPVEGGVWDMLSVDVGMEGTWAGGTDMLIRAVDYILADASPDVPVAVGFSWGDRKTIGKIEGRACGAQAVDLAGKGEFSLFIAAEQGDRVFRYDPKAKDFKDITAALKLASKSRLSAWADFNGDGRLDLASWDGKALKVWLQGADGAFPAAGAEVAAELKDGCLGLAVLDAGVEKAPGLLASTPGAPGLLVPQKGGAFKATALAQGAAAKDLGAAGPCVAADLDGDGLGDVLQVCAKGALFYKGQGAGAFAEARKLDVAAGKAPLVAFAGDYDADGRLDVFTAGEDGCRLWHDRGNLKFEETFGISGEISYTAGPDALAGGTCDVNNDGRADIFLAYPSGIPMIFFNRGFRSFGKALEMTEQQVIPETAVGQQAGAVEDFNGDGAQDMALVLKNGEVMVFLRKTFEGEAPLAARAALPLGGAFAGPLTVTGWKGKRCLGAWNVVAGSADAFFGQPGAGEVVLKWQFPGGKPQQKAVELDNKAVRISLEAGK